MTGGLQVDAAWHDTLDPVERPTFSFELYPPRSAAADRGG
jgi:hypothetical protein